MDPIVWCKEKLWVPPHPVTASLLFVDKPQQMPILALRALLAELAQITTLSHEVGLAQAKLNWWREAVIENRRHPALEALSVLGIRDRVETTDLLALLNAIEKSLSQGRLETTEQMWEHCVSLGGVAARLEANMLAPSRLSLETLNATEALGAASYWLRLVRDLAGDAHQGRWCVPLDLQADHQINRAQVVEGPPSAHWAGLVRAMVAVAQSAIDSAERELMPLRDQAIRHLLICAALDRRLGRSLAKSPERVLKARLLPSHFGNVWVAWRQARRIMG